MTLLDMTVAGRARQTVGRRRLATGWATMVVAAIVGCGGKRDGAPVAPEVLATAPASGARDVSVAPTIELTWNTPMVRDSGRVSLEPGGELRAAFGSWSVDGTVVTLEPDESLPAETPIVARVDGFISDEGVAQLDDLRFEFETGPDDVPPDLRSSRPMDGEMDVDPDAVDEIILVFDEDMDVSTTNVPITATRAGTRNAPGRWDDDGRVLVIDAATADLSNDTMVALDLSGFTDLAGNALGETGAGGDGRLTFATGPNALVPFVQAATPQEGFLRTPTDLETIEIVFSERMDESVVDFTLTSDDLDRAPARELVGAYTEAGLVLTLPLTEPLARGVRYSLDLQDARDLSGEHIPDDEAYTMDGFLDFSTLPATGENCASALSAREATVEDGRMVFTIPATDAPLGQVRSADGGAASCSPIGDPIDAVIEVEKTTPAFSDGGTILHVSATLLEPEGEDRLGLEIVRGTCAPAQKAFSEEQLTCVSNGRRWDRFLDVGPGSYWIFVTGEEAGTSFPGATVTVEELDDAAAFEGETCLAPYDVDSPNHTETSRGRHVWMIGGDDIHGFDGDISWGGAGSISCIDDFSYGDRSGPDAFIEYEKADPDSVLEIDVTGSFDLVVEVLTGACGVGSPDRASRYCGSSFIAQGIGVGLGYAGPVFIALASDDPAERLGTATVSLIEREVPAVGDACGRGIPLTAGMNTNTRPATTNLGRPSCFRLDGLFTWYEYTMETDVVTIGTNGPTGERVALVRPGSSDVLGCREPPDEVTWFGTAGDRICIGVLGGVETTTIDVTNVSYDGVSPVPARTATIDLPPTFDPDRDPRISERWVAGNDDRAYVCDLFGSIYEVRMDTETTVLRDASDGLSSAINSRGGATVGGELFTLGTGVAGPWLYRVWDGTSPMWSPSPWDGDTNYGSGFSDSLATDGDVFLVATRSGFDGRIFEVPREGGDPRELTSASSSMGRINGLAVDASYVYVANTADDTITRYRRDQLDEAGEGTTLPHELSALTDVLVVDGDADSDSRYLYFTSFLNPQGVHVIADPAGPAPRYLGRLFETEGIDSAIYYNPRDDRLTVFDTLANGRSRPRIVQLE